MYYKSLCHRLFYLLFLLMLQPFWSIAQEQEGKLSSDSHQAADTSVKQAPAILQKIVEIMEDKVEEQKENKDPSGLLIDGLVIDETRTKIGRDFYDVFFSNWDAPEGANNFMLTIRELPGRANSSFVSIEVNDQEILELPLQPRYDIIEETALYAVGRCYEYLRNYEQIQKDLSTGDLSGTGIY